MTADVNANTVGFSDVAITVLGLDVEADVPPFSYEGELEPVATIRVGAFSMKELMQRLGIEPPVTADPDALEKLTIDATAKVTAPAIRLDPLELVVDDTTFNGDMSIARDAAGTITVNLAGDTIDLTSYMEPVAEEGTAAEDAPVEIPVDLVRTFNLRGAITIGEALFNGMTFENVELGISAMNGRLRLNPFKAALFDGTYSGDIRIDTSGQTPSMSFDEKVTGVNVAKLANAMFELENVTGTINGVFKLAGSGADVAAVQRSLGGSMQFELLEGYYEGRDVWYELRRARALLKKEDPPEPKLPARTYFDALRLSGPVNDGVFRNDDVFADLQFLRMTGKGTVDLATTDIDYNLTARVIERPEFEEGASEEEQQEFEKAVIPLRVTGTVIEPSIKPDVGKMLEKEVKKKVRERLLDELFGDEEEAAPAEGDAQQLAPEEEKDDKDKLKDALRDLLKRD